MAKRPREISDMEEVHIADEEDEPTKFDDMLESMSKSYDAMPTADFLIADLLKAHAIRIKRYQDPAKTPFIQVLSNSMVQIPDDVSRHGEVVLHSKKDANDIHEDVIKIIPKDEIWDVTGYAVLRRESSTIDNEPHTKYTIGLYVWDHYGFVVRTWNVLHPVWDVKYPGGYPGSDNNPNHVERKDRVAGVIEQGLDENYAIFCTQETFEDLATDVTEKTGATKVSNYYDGKTPHKPNQLGLKDLAESQSIFSRLPNFQKEGGSTFGNFTKSHGNGYVIGSVELNGKKHAFISAHISWGPMKRNIELAKIKYEIQRLIMAGYSSVVLCGDLNTSLYNVTRKLLMKGVRMKATEPRWITRPASKSEDDKRIDHIIIFGHGNLGHYGVEEGTELLSDHKLVYAQLRL